MADLINKNDISFRCSYGGECMAEIEDCKVCVHYVCDYEDVQNVAVIAEQEIRAKVIDEFAERMKDICKTHSVGEDEHTNEPLYAHEDGTWHNLIDDVAEQMKVGGENE